MKMALAHRKEKNKTSTLHEPKQPRKRKKKTDIIKLINQSMDTFKSNEHVEIYYDGKNKPNNDRNEEFIISIGNHINYRYEIKSILKEETLSQVNT